MFAAHRTTRVLVASLLAGVLACDRHAAVAPPGPPEVSTDGRLLVTHVVVSTTAIHAGETMEITVSAENPTDKILRIGFSSGCVLVYAVKDPGDGTVVAPYFACTTNAPIVEWAPHETRAAHFTWDGTTGLPAPYDAIAPGDYDLVGRCWSEAAPIRIQLLAP